MRFVTPEVYLIAAPAILDPTSQGADHGFKGFEDYIHDVGGSGWLTHIDPVIADGHDGSALVEFGGKLCYRAWEPGLNVNVTKVREDNAEYIGNVISQLHGSVLEHANYSFVFHNVSRVFTHELVRHRAGVAISQESMRYVRLTDIPMWIPEWAREDADLMAELGQFLQSAEDLQVWMSDHFGLDVMVDCSTCEGSGEVRVDDRWEKCITCDGNGEVSAVPFSEKKAKTSFMRRFAPDGVATGMLWTANARALRHIIQLRTDKSAEEEIRIVFNRVGEILRGIDPNFLADFEVDEIGQWIPKYRKV